MALMKLPRLGTDDVRYNVYLSTERKKIRHILYIIYANRKNMLQISRNNICFFRWYGDILLPRNARYIISTCNIFMLTYKLLISNFNIFMLTCNIIISRILYWFVHIYVYVTYKVKVSFHFCSADVALKSCNQLQYILVLFQLISRSVKKNWCL